MTGFFLASLFDLRFLGTENPPDIVCPWLRSGAVVASGSFQSAGPQSRWQRFPDRREEDGRCKDCHGSHVERQTPIDPSFLAARIPRSPDLSQRTSPPGCSDETWPADEHHPPLFQNIPCATVHRTRSRLDPSVSGRGTAGQPIALYPLDPVALLALAFGTDLDRVGYRTDKACADLRRPLLLRTGRLTGTKSRGDAQRSAVACAGQALRANPMYADAQTQSCGSGMCGGRSGAVPLHA